MAAVEGTLTGACGVDGRGFEQVELITEGGLATVRLNRPERYNALGARMVEELGEALDEVETSGEARVMILTGTGGQAFRSGVDLKERAAMDADERWAHNRPLNAFAGRLARLQVPTIAAMNGLAFGGGSRSRLPATSVSPSKEPRSRCPRWASG